MKPGTLTTWARRLAAAVAVFVVLEVVLVLLDTGPDAARLALLVAIGTAALGLVADGLGDATPSWTVEVEQPSVRESGDPRLGRYVNLLEAHLTARARDAALRERLAAMADQVLGQRYGVRRGDARADELLGPDLIAVLTGPVRRLAPDEIDRCLTRIEEL